MYNTLYYTFHKCLKETFSAFSIYIGSTVGLGLRKRTGGLVKAKGKHVAKKRVQRIIAVLGKELEFRVKVEPSPEAEEGKLLEDYEGKHLELPPCNHNRPRKP